MTPFSVADTLDDLAAIVVADVLGFMGLLILGAMTWLVCVLVEMD